MFILTYCTALTGQVAVRLRSCLLKSIGRSARGMSSSGQCPRTPAVGARSRAQTAGSCCGCPSEDTPLASRSRSVNAALGLARQPRIPRRPNRSPVQTRRCRAALGPLRGGASRMRLAFSISREVGGGARRRLCKASARRRPATERSEGAQLGAPTKRA